MKVILLIAAIAHAVSCGNVRTSSLLSPAGVTYVDGSYHAGLTAGPVNAYSAPGAGASTVAVTASPLVQSSPSAISPAPVAYASGSNVVPSPLPLYSSTLLTEYAAVPSVQHVPAVADVPVTRINNQPGVIQKTLDVASPAVKTQRFEVRRPAIQKQFYDIEERVIVRPAGSAVVELNEPISRTQKGPSVIQPAGGAATVTANQPVSVVTGPEVSSGQTSLPSANYNLRGSTNALPPSPPSPQSSIPLQASVYSSQTPNILSSAPVQSSVVPVPNHSAFLTAPVQSAAGVSAISAGSSGYNSLPSRSLSAAPEIVNDGSIVLENPNYNNVQSGIAASTFAHGAQSDQSYQTVGASSPGFSLENLSRSVFQPVTPQVYSVPVVPPVAASVAPQAFPNRQTIFKSALPTTQFSAPVAPVSVRTDTPTYTAFNDFVPQKFSGASVNPEVSIQSQINQENQQKLIQLLTAKGGVTEVSFGRTGSTPYQLEAGDVRARVVSATPAPSFADPTNERITTRRVVVSRPIQTLQEVEVAEPVTKYERVQVSQPAVIKTASQDVVSVPTSIPVYGKVLTPVAQKTFSALHSEWQ